MAIAGGNSIRVNMPLCDRVSDVWKCTRREPDRNHVPKRTENTASRLAKHTANTILSIPKILLTQPIKIHKHDHQRYK
jgi:hypothetical protein